ncbi:zinc ribbon domain-containing protein [Nocardia seriolae]|uniref:Transposase InsQ for insertion sequence element IS609 n=2 Tax=Nocardia seriolae TaxID=37332 RepID=A0A0B8NN46_9NOCA|nr:Putative transposase InsQ for insertion sequence element IS609 [Nocardia seriolae]MTJ65550.1 IS200/IS605 family element transposase accessory protein TnpB [Nocardia seriolae]MTJ75108.1 IS200/IS605 family element transposase accessory protein TnpB [Nocardia seriolae]MTJ90428.1 IS200/IS605 family element transposase accessory protein TnpB [Nocardia seriolae]MTK34389.1 IS200/IS605 family element transposase accessory protein TnpB [Nocardia seriolae]
MSSPNHPLTVGSRFGPYRLDRLIGRGRQLFAWLKARDDELVALTSALQANGIRPRNSARYRRLQSRIRGHVRNEVGRILNRLALEDVKTLVVERLRFTGGGLSRQMNRLLARAGRGAVNAKLASLTETHGIAVVEVNPAYTSQSCTGCGYVDRLNRITRSRHQCRFCGKRLHADISGARTILRRSHGASKGWLTLGKQAVLARLDRNFRTRWGVNPTILRERPPRGRSTAIPDPSGVNRRVNESPRKRILHQAYDFSDCSNLLAAGYRRPDCAPLLPPYQPAARPVHRGPGLR